MHLKEHRRIHNWLEAIFFYASSPFYLILKCLQKIKKVKGKTPIEQSPYPGGEHILRSAFRRRGLSESSLTWFLVIWFPYHQEPWNNITLLTKAGGSCHSHDQESLLAAVSYNIKFLTLKFEKGDSFSTLNSHKSALSLVMDEKVGTDDRIKRFLRGVFLLKPALVKYTDTWNPQGYWTT